MKRVITLLTVLLLAVNASAYTSGTIDDVFSGIKQIWSGTVQMGQGLISIGLSIISGITNLLGLGPAPPWIGALAELGVILIAAKVVLKQVSDTMKYVVYAVVVIGIASIILGFLLG